MQAWLLEKKSKTPVLTEQPLRAPGAGEVRVRTLAVSIHPVDLETRGGGNAMLLPLERPFVPGVDFVGTVDAVGDDVDTFAPGQTVFGYRGITTMGAFSEVVTATADTIALAPDGYTPEDLATLPLPGLCALQALETHGVTSGRVLVHGGAGGVGSIAVQVFAARGLEVVATAGTADVDWVRELGATEVIDYREERFDDRLDPASIDLVFDTVGKDTLARSFALVKPGGAVVSLAAIPAVDAMRGAGMTVPLPMAWLLPLVGWPTNRRARKANARFEGQVTLANGALLGELARIAASTRLQSRIDRVFAWTELAAALDHAENGAKGRVVVRGPDAS